MDIIEKIEIKHFRSFDGGKDQTKVRISSLKDLNVFSGSNDSGKSNVLRALNLFFNNEISPGVIFEKNRDFSKIVSNRFDEDIRRRKEKEIERIESLDIGKDKEKAKDLRRSDEVVTIKLHFNNTNQQRGLPKKFWISRSYSQKNNFEGEYIYQTNLRGNAQVTLFLNSFKYEYVPAIKDRAYFNHLFGKLQAYLFEKGDKMKENKFTDSSEKFNRILRAETEDLFQKFLSSSGVDASFHIPSTLVDFFRTLSVKTENDISLFDRGDGVQARFIPEILDEISKGYSKNVIWGFEEPENSYEAGNIRKLKEDFQNQYSRTKQVFITTHTKEYLSLKRIYTEAETKILSDRSLVSKAQREAAFRALQPRMKSSAVSIYRVWKNTETNNTSFVTRFDENNNGWEDTCDDLGIIQESRVIEQLQENLNLQNREVKQSRLSAKMQKKVNEELLSSIEDCVKNLSSAEQKIEEYEKPILIVEDKHADIYKVTYLKSRGIEFTVRSLPEVFQERCPFVIRRGEGAGAVAGALSMNNTDGYEDKKIIGLFDYDAAGSERFYQLKNQPNWDANILGDRTTGHYKKRNQHPCFYALLLPIPSRLHSLVSDLGSGTFTSFIEIENLLPQDILVAKNMVEERPIMDKVYYKTKDTVKARAAALLTGVPSEKFGDFVPLYDKLEQLFGV